MNPVLCFAGLAGYVCEQCGATSLHDLHVFAAFSGVVWHCLPKTCRKSREAALAPFVLSESQRTVKLAGRLIMLQHMRRLRIYAGSSCYERAREDKCSVTGCEANCFLGCCVTQFQVNAWKFHSLD